MSTKTVIPRATREEISKSPFYTSCALFDQECGGCDGRITIEHAIIFAGKKLQDIWALVPLCEKHHAVDNYQDAGTMVKERNVWVAVNRATEDELLHYSKAINYIELRARLNLKYGVWQPKINYDLINSPKRNNLFSGMISMASNVLSKPVNPKIYSPDSTDLERIREIQTFLKEHGEAHHTQEQVISESIRQFHESLISLKK